MTQEERDTDKLLRAAARDINRWLDGADQSEKASRSARVQAGLRLIEAQALHVAQYGKHGGWEKWCKANIERSQGDIRKVMELADATEPEAAAQRAREVNKFRNARLRQWKKDHAPAPAPKRAHVSAVSEPGAEPVAEAATQLAPPSDNVVVLHRPRTEVVAEIGAEIRRLMVQLDWAEQRELIQELEANLPPGFRARVA